jgi:hypothetical protein
MSGLVSLKNVKIVASLSEETTCFTASIYFKGKRIGDVSNRGTGGCHNYGVSNKPLWAEFEAHVDGLEDMDSFERMDMVIYQLLDEFEHKKELKRMTRNQVIFRVQGDEEGYYRTLSTKNHSRERIRSHLQTKYGADLIEIHGVDA